MIRSGWVGLLMVSGIWAQGNMQERLNALVDSLAANSVVRMDILQIPAEVTTRTRMSAQMLERQFHYRLTIGDVRLWSGKDSLTAALRSVRVKPGEPADLRWGLIFYALNGRRVESLYFDGDGASAQLGDVPAVLEGKLFSWIRERFAGVFE